MIPRLDEAEGRTLKSALDGGAEDASRALTRWLGLPVLVAVGAVDEVDLSEATGLLGPGDTLVAACVMELSGGLTGQLILAFEDRSGLALVDLLLREPPGTTEAWGELARSAAKETANIVGCAYLNSLAAALPVDSPPLVPGPPSFRHEFAASLLEFALMDQAIRDDRLLLIRSRFSTERTVLDWSLLFVPGGDSSRLIRSGLAGTPPVEPQGG